MPGQLHCDIIDDVKRVTREITSEDPNLGIELQVIQSAHAAEVSPDEYVVRSISAAHERVWGARPEITWDGWYADTAPLTRAGIPSICYGPQGRARGGGTGYYPKEGEHVHVEDLTKGTEVFVHAALDVCMKDRKSVRAPNAVGTVVR